MSDPATEIFEWTASDERETERLGAELAAVLPPGAVVALVGDLGAGKTRLVKAVAAALGADPNDVSSPTFTLLHEYQGRVPIYHLDTYRLKSIEEFLDLGIDELLDSGGITFVEWADRMKDALPRDLLWIEIESHGETQRAFRLHGSGPQSAAMVGELRARLK